MTLAIALALLLQAAPAPVPALPPAPFPNPSPEAERLGRRLAETGTLAALLPLIGQKETEEMVRDQKDLTPSEQQQLRAVAARTLAAGTDRLMAASGHAYATRLTEADLRAAVAFQETQAARNLRQSLPLVLVETMTRIGQLDYKGDVLAAFCKETGKGCAK